MLNRVDRVASVALVALLVTLTGCSGKVKVQPRAFNVAVDGAPASQMGTARVHLVAVSEGELGQWESVDTAAYWQASHPLRTSAENQGLVHEMQFGPGSTQQTLSKSHPRWSGAWKAKNWLVLLADLPGGHVTGSGAADSWRDVISLDSKRWEPGTDTLEVVLQPGAMYVKTRPLELE